MELTQLSTSEFKLESVTDFCLSSQENCMILIGNSCEVIIFELMYSCNTMILMPYNNKHIIVSQDKPLNILLKNIDLVSMYERGNVLEAQELALDAIYIAECSIDPIKARVLQAEFLPNTQCNLLCILTTYGLFAVYKKNTITGEWHLLETNISSIIYKDVFPSSESPSNIKTINDLKKFINKYLITCFNLSIKSSDTIILYLGTSAGYLVALKYIESSKTYEKYCTSKISSGRITYITSCQNLLLLGCDQGKVYLVKINHENECFEQLDNLWDKEDRMSCRKAIIHYSENLNSYLVIFCKSAHVLAYRLDMNGVILSNSTLYVSGIKISGLESYSENKFIITTITSDVKHIEVVCPTKEELNIVQLEIKHDFDSSNYQILGVAASSSKNLWSFLLYRNKEYVSQSKYSPFSAFVNVCKFSVQDSFTRLINLNLKCMDIAQDLIMAINLEIFNNLEIDKYANYLALEELSFPEQFNESFLQKLQIKLIIMRKLANYQKLKFKKVRNQTENEIQFLEPSIQLLYILERLQYLKKFLSSDTKFSPFQELSIVCMQIQFGHLIDKLATIKNSEQENNLRKTVENFLSLITNEFEINKFNVDNFSEKKEYCIWCNEAMANFEKCEKEHKVKRCIISYTQILLYKTKYCPHCYSFARNDIEAKLNELFPTDECIKCTFCRFMLKDDDEFR